MEPFIQDALHHSPEDLNEKGANSGGATWLHSVAEFTRDRQGKSKASFSKQG